MCIHAHFSGHHMVAESLSCEGLLLPTGDSESQKLNEFCIDCIVVLFGLMLIFCVFDHYVVNPPDLDFQSGVNRLAIFRAPFPCVG